jgi:hypothetical protein
VGESSREGGEDKKVLKAQIRKFSPENFHLHRDYPMHAYVKVLKPWKRAEAKRGGTSGP